MSLILKVSLVYSAACKAFPQFCGPRQLLLVHILYLHFPPIKLNLITLVYSFNLSSNSNMYKLICNCFHATIKIGHFSIEIMNIT
jgi:hypothetical protein